MTDEERLYDRIDRSLPRKTTGVVQCDCGVLVDTDYDDEYYGEDGNQEGSCKGCREGLLIRQTEDERLDDPRHGQAGDLNKRTF